MPLRDLALELKVKAKEKLKGTLSKLNIKISKSTVSKSAGQQAANSGPSIEERILEIIQDINTKSLRGDSFVIVTVKKQHLNSITKYFKQKKYFVCYSNKSGVITVFISWLLTKDYLKSVYDKLNDIQTKVDVAKRLYTDVYNSMASKNNQKDVMKSIKYLSNFNIEDIITEINNAEKRQGKDKHLAIQRAVSSIKFE